MKPSRLNIVCQITFPILTHLPQLMYGLVDQDHP